MLDREKTTLLEQPLDMTQIKHRSGGGGRQLAYISGKFAMDQANRIFGHGQWGYKVVNRGQLLVDGPDGSKLTMYTADVELQVTGAAFTFPGAGIGIVTKPYTVEMHEKAYKEAETDAMKRALRHYGDQFGLVLYDGEDYVDAGNGEMVQVKNVPVNGSRPQQPPRPTPMRTNPTATSANVNKSESDPASATDQQVASIRKLCQHLGKSEPANVTSVSFAAAKQLIQDLTKEYKDDKPSTPELRASVRQMCQKLKKQPPVTLDQMKYSATKRLLETLTGEYGDMINANNGHADMSAVHAPDVKTLRKQCAKLGLVWDAMLISALKVAKPDDNCTPEDCARIKEKLDIIEKLRTEKDAEAKVAS